MRATAARQSVTVPHKGGSQTPGSGEYQENIDLEQAFVSTPDHLNGNLDAMLATSTSEAYPSAQHQEI